MTQQQIELLGTDAFAELIEIHRPTLIKTFIEIAKDVVPAATTQPTSLLKDHLPEILIKTAETLRSRGSQASRTELCALASLHGKTRADVETYTLDQVRREYRILRQQTMGLLKPNQMLDRETASIYADICELSVSATTSAFVALTSRQIT